MEKLPRHFRSCERQNMAGVANCDPQIIAAEPICGSYAIVSTGAPPAAMAVYFPL